MKVNKCVLRSRLIDEHPCYTLVLINGLNTNYTSLCSYYIVVLLTFYRFKIYDAALGLLCKSSCGPPSNLSLRPLIYTLKGSESPGDFFAVINIFSVISIGKTIS